MTTTATLAGLSDRLTNLYAAREWAANPAAEAFADIAIATFAQELLARIAALEEALKPFAREGRKLVEQQDAYSWCNTGLSNANLRRAALTLKENDCG